MFILDTCQDLGFIIAIIKFALNIIQWVVPIILVLLGTIDLVKAVISGKDDDIKKNQTALIKRIIYAIIVFLVPMLVGIVMGWIGNTSWRTCWGNTGTNISGYFKGIK